MHPALQHQDHRPWPLPQQPWVMKQQWHQLLFLHYPVDQTWLRQQIPADLQIDTHQGQAYLGVVPFRMSHIAPRGIPSVPGISHFPEINLRSYVIHNDKPGVYFFNLDIPSHLSVYIAQTLFHLPYQHSPITVQTQPNPHDPKNHPRTHYHSRHPQRHFDAHYHPTGPVTPSNQHPADSLAHWATERYSLYTHNNKHQLKRGEIHHPPWPLQPAQVDIHTNTLLTDIPSGPLHPDILYSHHLPVIIYPLQNAHN